MYTYDLPEIYLLFIRYLTGHVRHCMSQLPQKTHDFLICGDLLYANKSLCVDSFMKICCYIESQSKASFCFAKCFHTIKWPNV